MENKNNSTNLPALYTLMTVWFFWSFVAASNGILIPLFKLKFDLTQTQAQLVDFAFYAAYFIGSVLYLIFSKIMKGDILNKIGYKNGIVIGLLISAVGSKQIATSTYHSKRPNSLPSKDSFYRSS